MALPKSVKQGGSYFKGFQNSVTGSGDFVIHVTTNTAFMVNSIEYICDDSNGGDFITISHCQNTDTSGAINVIADTLYNPGPLRSHKLTLPALEPFAPGEDMRVTYTCAGTSAIDFKVYVEFIRFTKVGV